MGYMPSFVTFKNTCLNITVPDSGYAGIDLGSGLGAALPFIFAVLAFFFLGKLKAAEKT